MSNVFSKSPFWDVDELAEWLYTCALPNARTIVDLAGHVGCNVPELTVGHCVLRMIKDTPEREIWAIQVEVVDNHHAYYASVVQFLVDKMYPDTGLLQKVIQSYKLVWGRHKRHSMGEYPHSFNAFK